MGSVRRKQTSREAEGRFILLGGQMDLSAKTLTGLTQQQVPVELDGQFKRCRALQESNPYVLLVLRMWLAFYHHGFEITPSVPLKKGDARRFKEWRRLNRDKVALFAKQLWEEYLLLDNAPVWWDQPNKLEPVVLPPEECLYQDKLGLEILKYRHGLTQEQRDMLPAALQEKYKSDWVTYKHPEDSFVVLKRARKGCGFGTPRMRTIFNAGATYDNLEVGEIVTSFFHRTVIRWHKLGMEPKSNSGPLPANFKASKYTPTRAKAIDKEFKNAMGAREFIANWDHELGFVTGPTEYFKKEKWEAVTERFMVWAGPVGRLFMQQGINTDLMQMFQAEAEMERLPMRVALNQIIAENYQPPVPVTVNWSDTCFLEPAKVMEAMKWAVQQGPMSLRTFMVKQLGEDWLTEQENKKEEAELDDELVEPRFDQAHGNDKEGAGRPEGSKDKDKNPGAR